METEIKRKLLGDLKQFAKSEMARDLAKRHGKSLRLPWDPEAEPVEPAAEGDELKLDAEALEQLANHA